jgi:hypothetical protein
VVVGDDAAGVAWDTGWQAASEQLAIKSNMKPGLRNDLKRTWSFSCHCLKRQMRNNFKVILSGR